MIYKIILLPSAFTDIKEINFYYKNINKKLAEKFNDNLKYEIKIIKKNPYLFQIRYNNFYIVKIKTFPYLIHFEIYDNLVVINAIYHSSRDSKLNIF